MASYYETTDFLAAPPASFHEGLLGYGNPALPALTGTQAVGILSTEGSDAASVQDWGLFSSIGGLSSSVVHRDRGALSTTGYHVSLARGSDEAVVGLGFQGFSGDATALGRYNRLTAGTILRPTPYLSIGLIGNVSLETDDREVVSEVGVRPLGTSRLTLFADAAWADGQAITDVPWSAGATVEVTKGIDLVGRVFEDESFTAGLRVELGRLGLDSQSRVNPSSEYAGQIHRVRAGDYAPSVVAEAVKKDEEHVEMGLQEPVQYRQMRLSGLLGEEPSRFYELLRTVRQAGESDRVTALALNLSGLQMRPELAWELRTALRRAQQRGLRVVAVLESGGMTAYHLATAADVIALDPQGTLQLPGYAGSRTFLKGTLNKVGLGVQAWRFFEYKSAFERFSRTDYSQADSLQRQLYINDRYELFQQNVTARRPLDPDSLDRLIDEKAILTAQEARHAGLVDTLARWHERSDLLRAITDDQTSSLEADHLNEIATATRKWSAPPEIAVVYGIGATSVEGGMGSRALSKKIRTLAADEDVAAVVFRVDSPGGAPVAAAQVGEAIRRCAAEKPVIVSQGQVAASGGYWVSAYADRILAGPTTVTGSIGVIGGWIYDKGFSEKTGLSADVVQRGERADLLQGGLELPLLGLSVPTRKLTEEEMARIEDLFRKQYAQFVATVAEGRDTTEAHVRDVAEGRIYSGRDGKDVGLVDEIGGLPRAIERARTAAGLAPEEAVVREVNPTAAFSLASLLPAPLGTLADALGTGPKEQEKPLAQTDPTATFMRLMVEHQPHPLVLLPPNAYPQGE